jgi:hypothetical protein
MPVSHERQEDDAVAGVGECLSDASDLGGHEDAPPSSRDARTLDVNCRVRLDELLTHGRVEDVDEHVHVQVHRCGRVLLERRADELGNVPRADRGELVVGEEGA